MLILQRWLLLFGGGLVILLGILLGVVGSRTNRRRFRYPSVLLLLLGAALLLTALVGAALVTDVDLLVTGLVFGGLLFVLGSVVLIIEIRRQARVKQGGLILALGILASVASLILPIVPSQLQPLRYSTATPTPATPTRTPAPTRTLAVTFTPSVEPSPTLSPSPLPTLTHTPTPGTLTDLITPLATSEATLATSRTVAAPQASATAAGLIRCQVRPFRNVNLREKPDADSRLLTTIPFDTALEAAAQVNEWWRVRYGEQVGWITKAVVTADAGCKALPAP
jgi:hypothetical protein